MCFDEDHTGVPRKHVLSESDPESMSLIEWSGTSQEPSKTCHELKAADNDAADNDAAFK